MIDFRRQNLTSIAPRLWRLLTSIVSSWSPHWKGSDLSFFSCPLPNPSFIVSHLFIAFIRPVLPFLVLTYTLTFLFRIKNKIVIGIKRVTNLLCVTPFWRIDPHSMSASWKSVSERFMRCGKSVAGMGEDRCGNTICFHINLIWRTKRGEKTGLIFQPRVGILRDR